MVKVGGKLWGGILGMMFGGPIGAIAGVFIGHQIDEGQKNLSKMDAASVFQINLLAILAYVAQVDGHVDKREIDTILSFFKTHRFNTVQMAALKRTLEFSVTQKIDLRSTCENFKKASSYESRMMLLRMVYLVVMADNKVHPKEKKAIEQIVEFLGITSNDYQMLQAEYLQTNDKYFEILGLSKDATISEVKKTYRKLALSYHPDRVAYLGKEYAQIAEEKFKLINEAYQHVLKEVQSS